jgi:hypothetical protein
MDKQIDRAMGFAPVGMSLVALALVLGHVAAFRGLPPAKDEGPEAHIFQLLMVAQVPIILLFMVTAGRKSFVRILPVLGLQALAWIAAWGAVYFFNL